MSATSAPFGFIPAKHPNGSMVNAAPYRIASGYATDLYKYQPVKLVTAGTIQAGAATEDLIGVFAGVEYTDALGRRVVDTQWPASTVATDIVAWVWDDPATIFVVQADGSVPQAGVGAQADITNATANANRMSSSTLNSTLEAAAAQGQFRIIGFDGSVDNAVGDAFTKVLVQIAQHQYRGDKAGI